MYWVPNDSLPEGLREVSYLTKKHLWADGWEEHARQKG